MNTVQQANVLGDYRRPGPTFWVITADLGVGSGRLGVERCLAGRQTRLWFCVGAVLLDSEMKPDLDERLTRLKQKVSGRFKGAQSKERGSQRKKRQRREFFNARVWRGQKMETKLRRCLFSFY